MRTCAFEGCGASIEHRSKQARFCEAHAQRRRPARGPIERECAECGKMFMAHYTQTICSQICRSRRDDRRLKKAKHERVNSTCKDCHKRIKCMPGGSRLCRPCAQERKRIGQRNGKQRERDRMKERASDEATVCFKEIQTAQTVEQMQRVLDRVHMNGMTGF